MFLLQIIPNSFLANPHTSATFATILVKFLLNKLEDMGSMLRVMIFRIMCKNCCEMPVKRPNYVNVEKFLIHVGERQLL